MSLLLALTTPSGKTVNVSWLEVEAGIPAVNYAIDGDAGSYSLTGQAADITRGLLIDGLAGSYLLSGQAVTIARGRLIDGLAGSYALVGQDATISYASSGNYTINCEAGSYSLTGASAEIAYAGGSQDTHDGYWSKQWEKLRKKKPVIEEVIELVQEQPAIALAEVKEAVKREYPKVDYTQVLNNVQLQRFIAEQLLITLELRRIQDDEDDIETLLLML